MVVVTLRPVDRIRIKAHTRRSLLLRSPRPTSIPTLQYDSEGARCPISFLKEWGFVGINFFLAISGYVICVALPNRHS